MGPLSWSNWDLEKMAFVEGGRAGEPEEKPSEQGKNQQQTQSTFDTGSDSNATHIDGRRALSLVQNTT